MPAENRLGLDDNQARPPASPEARKSDPEDPVPPTEPRAFHRALEDGYLLAERQVLRGERRAALEQQPEGVRDDLRSAH